MVCGSIKKKHVAMHDTIFLRVHVQYLSITDDYYWFDISLSAITAPLHPHWFWAPGNWAKCLLDPDCFPVKQTRRNILLHHLPLLTTSCCQRLLTAGRRLQQSLTRAWERNRDAVLLAERGATCQMRRWIRFRSAAWVKEQSPLGAVEILNHQISLETMREE